MKKNKYLITYEISCLYSRLIEATDEEEARIKAEDLLEDPKFYEIIVEEEEDILQEIYITKV